MFDLARSVRVEAACLNRFQRQQVDGLVSSIYEAVSRWEQQDEENIRQLACESQLQQLQSMANNAVVEVCNYIESVIVVGDDRLVQLAQTAYNSLAAVGWDCAAFEWALDLAEAL